MSLGHAFQPPTSEVTELLRQSSAGNASATGRLAELLYQDLHREAERQFEAERTEHTLQPTALIHESFIRLVGQNQTEWQNREHFLAVASRMMRRVLTDHARHRLRQKRQGERRRLYLDLDQQLSIDDPNDVLLLHDLLQRLEVLDPRQAQIVELRFFAGMTNAEVAQALHMSLRTVEGEWAMAKAWLRKEIAEDG